MGAKQSKRSVDISGKAGEAEGEGGGEVVCAGGAGRLEPLADLDTLKPQLNGDTPHITTEQITEKEDKLENGTPENEKDATTEKETLKDAVITNGSSNDEPEKKEPQKSEENGDAKPTPETDNNKKNKKEKVKKKWSLRSISFNKKEKPKQEKKQKKEDEAQTNGDAEKVAEESTEKAVSASKEALNAVEESKDEKTPDTPVTEPITNGSSAPETPKIESPAVESSSVASDEKETQKVEPSPPVQEPVVTEQSKPALPVVEPEQLPLNGLSVEDEKKDAPETTIDTKVEEPTPAPEKVALVPDIPVSSEVCVGKSQLKESTPPPLPSNPPPSSVTAFAETTMAPHLASLVEDTPPIPEPISTEAKIEPIPIEMPKEESQSQPEPNIVMEPVVELIKNISVELPSFTENNSSKITSVAPEFAESLAEAVDEKIGSPSKEEIIDVAKREVVDLLASAESKVIEVASAEKICKLTEMNEGPSQNIQSSEFSIDGTISEKHNETIPIAKEKMLDVLGCVTSDKTMSQNEDKVMAIIGLTNNDPKIENIIEKKIVEDKTTSLSKYNNIVDEIVSLDTAITLNEPKGEMSNETLPTEESMLKNETVLKESVPNDIRISQNNEAAAQDGSEILHSVIESPISKISSTPESNSNENHTEHLKSVTEDMNIIKNFEEAVPAISDKLAKEVEVVVEKIEDLKRISEIQKQTETINGSLETEMILPPPLDELMTNGDENQISNEDISESFPLPPSECEVSEPSSLEPHLQEAGAAIGDKLPEMSVPEIPEVPEAPVAATLAIAAGDATNAE